MATELHPPTPTAVLPLYKGTGLFGYATDFMRNTPEFCHRMEAELGDFYEVKIPGRRLFVTFRPSVIRHVLQANARQYKKSVTYQQMKLFLGEGLVTSEGELWKRQRRLAQPVFYKAHMQHLYDTMLQMSDRYVEQLRERIRRQPEVDMAREMMQITSDIVMQALFSSRDETDKLNLYEGVTFFQQVILQRIYRPYLIPLHYLSGRQQKFNRLKRDFDRRMDALIQQRKASADRPSDLLTMLLEARDEETGQGMSDKQLRDELITLYMAGHETSANALAWTFSLLARHPGATQKLRAEARAVLGDRLPTFADIQKLDYSRQVIEEGMRLYPPAYVVSRVPVEDDRIEGATIPKDATVYISIYALQRSPKYWEAPDAFRPERFADGTPRHIYMPFGGGARMCIGKHSAMLEMQPLLVLLVRAFDLELLPGQTLDTQPLITLKPKHGIRLRLRAV